MELQVGVKALLKNKDGKYLLLQRSPDKYPEIGSRWDIVGGRIDPGTSLMDNLKREIKEETQLGLESEPRLVAAQDIMRVTEKHVVRLTYIGEIEGVPILDDDHIDYKWLTLEEIKQIPEGELDKYFKELLEKGVIE